MLKVMTIKERLAIVLAIAIPTLAVLRFILVGTGSRMDIEFMLIFALVSIPISAIVIALTLRNVFRRM